MAFMGFRKFKTESAGCRSAAIFDPKNWKHVFFWQILSFGELRERSSSLATQPLLQIASNQWEAESPSDQSAAREGGATNQQPINSRTDSYMRVRVAEDCFWLCAPPRQTRAKRQYPTARMRGRIASTWSKHSK